MRSTEELEKRIQYLEQENQYLKHLLSDAGISYSEKEIIENVHEYDPNHGAFKGKGGERHRRYRCLSAFDR